MEKKKHKPIKLKHFSDLKMHAPAVSQMNPNDHPVNNLASPGSGPLGQSGSQMMSPQDTNLHGFHPDAEGGGDTGRF